MAFLSQKLASIVTDLEIEKIDEENFSQKIQNEKYIEILKRYEFKSLIPKDCQEIKEKIKIKTEIVENQENFEKIFTKIQNSEKNIGISIDNYKKIFVSFKNIVYEIDSKKIDIFSLIDVILDEKIPVATYDSKHIFRELYNIRHPISQNQEQASLF